MRTISIRLDDRTDDVLSACCERHGVTQTNAVKAAIARLAEAPRPTPSELAERLGLIGALDRRDFGIYRTARGNFLRNALDTGRAPRRGRRR